MISIESITTKLDGYPPELLDAYARFLAHRNPDDLNTFVVGLIQFLQDASECLPVSQLSESTSLRDDLGVDSITIAEVVFLLEEILEIEIDNKDLVEITTIGDLKQYILRKID